MTAPSVVQQWAVRVHRMQIAHYDAAIHFERQNLKLGIPVVVFSTIVGTTIFATLSNATSRLLRISAGLMSAAAAVLASLQTFLKYSERAEKHRAAGARYANLKHELELMSALPSRSQETQREILESLRARWVAVHEEAPTVPQRIFDRAMRKARLDLIESDDMCKALPD
jgi:hypothetical protein